MRLSELCVYAKVRSRTEAQRLLRLKTSTRSTSKQAQCDCLILAQKVNKNTQIKGLISFICFKQNTARLLFNFILHAVLHFSF